MPFVFKCNTTPEKMVIAATAATVLSVIFDERKKKLRGSKKYRSIPKRLIKNYKLADSLLKKTLAKELEAKGERFKDEKLDKLTIENGEFIKL